MEHGITYRRDHDGTRLIFVMEGDLADCVQRAIARAPRGRGWRLAAVKEDLPAEPFYIAEDGDDYQ